ncbi:MULTISPECIES: MBL fold metallo-hydrolase [unclassified Streptomyces]|uniref:MBL fold metallo-hydrolase n=1 Tax=unclassified Streptomyces TaxID=2593676 RepID=UPI002E2C47E2|nr:MBL fold metallo-hydrolase [Streptomyces sp. NBC_00223]
MTAVAAPSAAGREQHRAWRERRLPPVEEIRPGLWSLPVPIPDNPLRYVLAYAVALDTGGIALVDTGWPADESWQGLQDAIGATGHRVEDVRTVLITHAHTDHHGLTSRIVGASGAAVGMHPAEAGVLSRVAALAVTGPTQERWLELRGAPRAENEELRRSLLAMGRFQDALAPPDFLVEDGSRPLRGRADLRAVWTPGHTEGHLCFLLDDERVLLSGDHVLPRITPNVSRAPGLDDDAIGSYLDSLTATGRLRVEEVLPAHEYRFAGLPGRVTAMLGHHHQRLAEIEAAVRAEPGCSTWRIAETISWSRGWESTYGLMRQTAISETYTHLRHLEKLGRVSRPVGGTDAWRLAAADPA